MASEMVEKVQAVMNSDCHCCHGGLCEYHRRQREEAKDVLIECLIQRLLFEQQRKAND